ncbi:MAG: hypothetical protein RRY29_08195, partial [Desulfovibrionaceae bacterium]
FNGCVTLDTPFIQEFFASINNHSVAMDEDSAFALFECLVIFFQEKRLRMGNINLAAPEQAVLAYFESSGHWLPQEHTLVNDWYWHKLPKKMVVESLHHISVLPF